MKFLRTVSTGRLLAMIAGLLLAVGGGTAIAVAAAGPGPTPPPKPLSIALHHALTAPPVTGISADISFSNHLIDASDIQDTQGNDPILSGATGRLWVSNDGRLRLELQSDNGDAQIVVDHNSFWISDPSTQTVYEGTLPADRDKTNDGAAKADHALPTVGQIESDLKRLMQHVDISGAIPSDVAGQAAYTVRISAKHDGGMLGSAEIAWDAVRGVPLRVAIYARNNPTPVLELKATNISYGPVPASDFAVSPPAGSKVVKISTVGQTSGPGSTIKHGGQRSVSGVSAVAARLPFQLTAPKTLVGLPRRTVRLLDWGGQPAALVTYGQNLGGIAVVERAPDTTGARKASQPGAGQSGLGDLSLPTVSINGATGHELDTALGTVVTFTRGGIAYTVLGSVPSVAADAAARGL